MFNGLARTLLETYSGKYGYSDNYDGNGHYNRAGYLVLPSVNDVS